MEDSIYWKLHEGGPSAAAPWNRSRGPGLSPPWLVTRLRRNFWNLSSRLSSCCTRCGTRMVPSSLRRGPGARGWRLEAHSQMIDLKAITKSKIIIIQNAYMKIIRLSMVLQQALTCRIVSLELLCCSSYPTIWPLGIVPLLMIVE